MDSHLEKLQRALHEVIQATPAQMGWHPPGKWCTAEILEHLYLTYIGTIKGLKKVASEGKPPATPPVFWNRVRTTVVLKFNYLPEGRKSPARAIPRGLPAEKVQTEILQKLAEMDEIMTHCEVQFGPGCKLMDHPILGPLNAREWRKFHLVHGLHHIKQIRKIRQQEKSLLTN
jgi:hypothetical protein